MRDSSPPDNETFRNHVRGTLARLRARVNSGHLAEREARLTQLRRLRDLLTENEDEIHRALWSDLRKSAFESQMSETGLVRGEIDFAIRNLKSWMKPERVKTPLAAWPARSEIRRDPYGVVLILSAWNYPVQLLLSPLVAALAGGNAVVLKPSEIATATAHLMARLVSKYFDPDLVTVIEGGVTETQALLDEKFDFIFFTGSSSVGRIIMEKASRTLTPVVLELGGKSPAIVSESADLKLAAKRIVWGKYLNAGQTCVAPDYVLIKKSLVPQFVGHAKEFLREFFGDDPSTSPDYGRIVNLKNFDRLKGYLNEGRVLAGGESHQESKYLAPTLITDVPRAAPLMRDEIFGPILPIVECEGLTDAIEHVRAQASPLALYLFSTNREEQERVLSETSSGGVCINDVLFHMTTHHLPFGGVGGSGMGHYHGRYGFNAFTHAKSVMTRSNWFDVAIRYAPSSDLKRKLLRRLM